MNVADLIAALQTLPADLEVVVWHTPSGTLRPVEDIEDGTDGLVALWPGATHEDLTL